MNPEDMIREFLISCGTAGASQRQITQRVARFMTGPEVTIYLNRLRDLRKVDKYDIKPAGQGRHLTWWRATTEILNDD